MRDPVQAPQTGALLGVGAVQDGDRKMRPSGQAPRDEDEGV